MPTELSTTAAQSLTTNNSLIENMIRPSIKHSYTSKQLKEMCNHVNSTNLTNLPFGAIRTICDLRLNMRTRKKWSRTRRNIVQKRINIWNLRQIATTDKNFDEIFKNIRISTVNARSIKSKENLISNELTNRRIDTLITTESWLQDNKQEKTWASSSKLGSPAFQMFTEKQKWSKRRGYCPHYNHELQSITTERCICLLWFCQPYLEHTARIKSIYYYLPSATR